MRIFALLTRGCELPLIQRCRALGPEDIARALGRLQYLIGIVISSGYATPGIGTPHHIVGEIFARSAGIDIQHVGYKGGAAAVTDLVGGQVRIMVGGLAPLRPYAEQNRLRILATTGPQRVEILPQVPTISETIE